MDIIWGNVTKPLTDNTFELNVTHRKDGNKEDYSDVEKIKLHSTDIVTLPLDPNECTKQLIEENLSGVFVKCEIKEKENDGSLLAIVSNSGQGGY